MTDNPTPADIARGLIRSLPTATLSTLIPGADNAAPDGGTRTGPEPYGSLVLVAATMTADPILLISTLAQHTQNIAADPRVSLLFDGTLACADRLTGPRVSLQGLAERSDDPHLRERFLARHPGAAMYAGFRDFAFYRVTITRAHQVAGFGRIDWIQGNDLQPRDMRDLAATLAPAESGIVGHMNEDHSDAIALYANVLLGRPGVGWRMTGIDPEGADLARPGDTARIGFSRPVGSADDARAELVRLVRRARKG